MIKCSIEYKNSPHLNQLYSGFVELHKANIIDLDFSTNQTHIELQNKPVVRVVLNNEIVIYYDTLDGFNWIDGDESSNLEYFKNTFNCNFYFKRSFSEELNKVANFNVLPLGLNFGVNFDFKHNYSFRQTITAFLKKNKVIIKLLKLNSNNFTAGSLSHYPDINLNKINILFSCRLWDPSLAKTEQSRLHCIQINSLRIETVKSLKKEFGENFNGGITKDKYSSTIVNKNLLLPFEFTNRDNYIHIMKQNAICIATTGLHNSTGWKLAEYVAASRAIITEPLCYDIPGDFKKNKNYIEFTSVNDLINKVNYLLKNENEIKKMMISNYSYYHLNLKPDIQIFNTLNQVFKN